MTDELTEPGDLFAMPVGEELAQARVAAGLSLDDVAARTRIPIRHLHAIEAGHFADLPSSTYAVGFVRAYGRALDMDEVALAAQVREEMNLPARPGGALTASLPMVVPEPDRIPPKAFAWTAATLAVLLIGGFLVWRAASVPDLPITASVGAEPLETGPAIVAAPPPAAPSSGEVVLTATDEVWIQLSDSAGETLVSRTFAPGERFVLPSTAKDPVVTVGRPEALTVTIGGRELPPLGPAGRPVRNLSLTAAASNAIQPVRAGG